MFQVSLSKKLTVKTPTVIIGFQGVGLVGSLAAAYLREKLELDEVGFVDTTSITPMALVVNKEVRFPVRVFEDPKRKIILFESESPIPSKYAYELAKQLVAFSKKLNAKKIICLEGVKTPNPEKESRVYGVSTSSKEIEHLNSKGIELLSNGVIVGLTAAIMLESKSKKIPCTCIMAEANADLPDGKAAAKILQGMNKVLHGVNVKTKDLLDQATDFENKMKDIVEKAKDRKLKTLDSKDAKDILYG